MRRNLKCIQIRMLQIYFIFPISSKTFSNPFLGEVKQTINISRIFYEKEIVISYLTKLLILYGISKYHKGLVLLLKSIKVKYTDIFHCMIM